MNFYIDHTNTKKSKFNTGIQRTVRKLISETKHFKSDYNFHLIDFENLFNKNSNTKKSKIRIPNFIIHSLHVILARIGILNLIYLTIFKIQCYKYFKNKNFNDCIYLNIDANWSDHNLHFIKKFSKKGGKIVSIYYDNGPYLYPEFFHPELVNSFKRHWNRCVDISDLILCISKTISIELNQFIFSNPKLFNLKKIPIIDYFYLGNDIKNKNNIDFFTISKDKNFNNYLVVGSIEPRKNNSLIFNSFMTLLKDNYFKSCSRLIFVYNNSWLENSLVTKIKQSPYYNENIFLLEDINDRELSYLYSTSYALINASYYEGFGLSIAEALNYKLKVFCSDIQTYKEIFKENVIYFNNSKSINLCNVIKQDLNNKNTKKSKIKIFSWSNSLEMLISKIRENIIL